MAKNLLIVESPAKAKTIEKILGDDFKVTSCYGHIRDLSKKADGVQIDKNFEPTYIVPDEKKDVVKELKKLAKAADDIWLATDEDREGEAISWHLCEILGLDIKQVKRIVFHEITKKAILGAVENPRLINENLVKAQQARRILDRLVGFELSPILWKKIRTQLSAGRVQSVAVRIIVEREREIDAFEGESSFRVTAEFKVEGEKHPVKAELPTRFKTEAEALEFVESCKGSDFSVSEILVKPAKRSPTAPFTTSTLQQEASRKIGYSVSKTMIVAQKLYEGGHITYMRTDSVNLSDDALESIESHITKAYGKEYSNPQKYKTKSSSAQEAHEAIRPTTADKATAGSTADEKRLYELIRNRTLASQMADAQLEKTTAKINISKNDKDFVAKGEVIKFDGFLRVYAESKDEEVDEDQSGMLPPLAEGQVLQLNELEAAQRFTRPPSRYTEASLVKKLEELGIGRPSTYAPTISTVQKRGYVEKDTRDGREREFRVISLSKGAIKQETKVEITGAEKNKIFPTDIGKMVNDFLLENFDKVMDYNFTAKIEKEFDEIAAGQMKWNSMIDAFYTPFHKSVEHTLEHAERVTGERALGDDPETGKPIICRMGRFGPMVQLGSQEDEEKPRYAKLRTGQTLETINLEEALILFKLPRELGMFEDLPVVASEGRFGPYVQHNTKFYSIKKAELDPYTVNLEQAIEVIKEKREADEKKVIRVFEENGIQILNGMYGPYLKVGIRNVRIPKGTDPETLSLEECLDIIDKAPTKGRGKKKS